MLYTTFPHGFNLQYAARQSPYIAFGLPVLYHHQPSSPGDSSDASSGRDDHVDSPESSIDSTYDYTPDALAYTDPSYFSTSSEFGQNQLQIQIPSDTSYVTTHFDNGMPTSHTSDLQFGSHYSDSLPSPSNMESPFDEYIHFEDVYSQDESNSADARDAQEMGDHLQTLSIEALLRTELNIPEPLPLDFSSLPDIPPNGRLPPITAMAKLAIWSSPHRMALLNDIYAVVEARYPWAAEPENRRWRGSIRHNLSLKKCFINVKRKKNDRGKGGYWKLEQSLHGNKRDRTRNVFPDNKPGSKKKSKQYDELSETFMAADVRSMGTPASSSSSASDSPLIHRYNVLYPSGTAPGNVLPSSSTISRRRPQRRREESTTSSSLSGGTRDTRARRLSSSSPSNLVPRTHSQESLGVEQRFDHLNLSQAGSVDYNGYRYDGSYATSLGLPGSEAYSNMHGLDGMPFVPMHRNTSPHMSSSQDFIAGPHGSHSLVEGSPHRRSTMGDLPGDSHLYHPGPVRGERFVPMEGVSLTPPMRTSSRRLRSEDSLEDSDEIDSEGRTRGSPRPRSSRYRG